MSTLARREWINIRLLGRKILLMHIFSLEGGFHDYFANVTLPATATIAFSYRLENADITLY